MKSLEYFTGQQDIEIKALQDKLDKADVIIVGYNSTTKQVGIIHKNSNSYKGPQAVYEIKVNGKVYKYGKADMKSIASSKLPRRLQSQLNQLEKIYGKDNVEGKVLREWKNISTKDVKRYETKQITKYLKKYGKIPADNSGHKKYGEVEKKPTPRKKPGR